MNNIIGFDASLSDTGVCILLNNLPEVLISVKGGKLRGTERLVYFERRFNDIIDTYHPIFALIENYAYAAGKTGHVFNIGELGGILRLCLFKKAVPFDVVSPPSVKKFCVGKGNCEKSLILKEVFRKWGIDTNNDNLADAFVIARIAQAVYATRNNLPITLTKYEKEVVTLIIKEPTE